MGQVFVPATKDIILTAVDRLIARNADGGISAGASHLVLFGENAGENLGDVDHVYVIGSDSLSGGLANPAQEGTTIYGANNLIALNNSVAALNDGPLSVMGFNIAPLAEDRVGSSVLIGGEIARNAPAQLSPLDSSVIVGYQAMELQRTLNASGGTFSRRCVILGYRAMRGTAFTVDGAGASINDSVVIGSEAMENAGFNDVAPGTTIEGNVAIGRRALRSVANGNALSSSFNTAIGFQVATQLRSGQRNVFLGSDILSPATDCFDDVLIGASIAGNHAVNNGQNVAIGAGITMTGLGSRNIFLGSGVDGSTLAGSDHLLVETTNLTSGVRRNLIYGNMGSLTGAAVTACGIIFGLSGAANRDLPGMNLVKIINGNRDAGLTAPVGGGYFYSSAGELHWVSTGNIDYALTGTDASGVYTPALTNVANLDASTAFECQWMRVGSTVTVSGKVSVDPTLAATSTQLGIALPVASNFGAQEDCGGCAFASGIAGQGAAILADAANNRAQMQWISDDVTNQPMYFTFSYQVI